MEIVPVYTSISNICEWPWQHNYRTCWSSPVVGKKKKVILVMLSFEFILRKVEFFFYLLKSHIDFVFCVFLCIIFVYLWGRVVSLLFVLMYRSHIYIREIRLKYVMNFGCCFHSLSFDSAPGIFFPCGSLF